MGSNVSTLPQRTALGEAMLQDSKMLSLIKRTVAKDCDDDEFSIFIAMCRSLRLDPLRKQAYAFVFKRKGKNNEPDTRQLTLVTSIAGFRTIADRTGNYRPDEEAAELHFDEAAKDAATNPLGLVKAIVRVHKFSHGAWHKVTAEAYWSEYAPIKDEWGEVEGRRKPTGRKILDTSGQWGKMPRVMLAKVAESAALRRAFPDELSNVHEDSEVDRERFLDLTPAEAVAQDETQRRLERIGGSGGPTVTVDWLKGEMAPLEIIPIGGFADRIMAFIREHDGEPSQIQLWRTRNRHALQLFWGHAPGDALEVKKALETAAGVP